jgi:hypothetical protein
VGRQPRDSPTTTRAAFPGRNYFIVVGSASVWTRAGGLSRFVCKLFSQALPFGSAACSVEVSALFVSFCSFG